MSQRNSLVVGGVDILARYGLVFTDDYDLGFPEVKTSYVDLAGGDGSVDLTETSGAVRYKDRSQTFTLLVPRCTQQEAEAIRTSLAALLHGRRYAYQLGVDPGYTYRGRFAIGQLTRIEHTAETIPVTVTADPYKTRVDSPITWLINAAGGVTLTLFVGRSVCPTIEVQRTTLVSHKGTTWELPPGASKISDLWLAPDGDELTINTYPEYSATTLSDYASQTIADVEATYPRIEDAAAGPTPAQVPDTLSSYADDQISDYADRKIVELEHPSSPGDEYSAYIQYDYQAL